MSKFNKYLEAAKATDEEDHKFAMQFVEPMRKKYNHKLEMSGLGKEGKKLNIELIDHDKPFTVELVVNRKTGEILKEQSREST